MIAKQIVLTIQGTSQEEFEQGLRKALEELSRSITGGAGGTQKHTYDIRAADMSPTLVSSAA